MKIRHLALFLVLMFFDMHTSISNAQTRKPLTNQDVIDMTKQALTPSIIVKAIEANQTDFDVSAQALLDSEERGSGRIRDGSDAIRPGQQAVWLGRGASRRVCAA